MFAHLVLDAMNLENLPGDPPGGYTLAVRLNWYRSLPLSCIDVGLTVDDEQVPTTAISLSVSGSTVAVADLAGRDDLWWWALEPATVTVEALGGLPQGSHAIVVDLRTRIPYWGPGPDGQFGLMHDRVARSVTL